MKIEMKWKRMKVKLKVDEWMLNSTHAFVSLVSVEEYRAAKYRFNIFLFKNLYHVRVWIYLNTFSIWLEIASNTMYFRYLKPQNFKCKHLHYLRYSSSSESLFNIFNNRVMVSNRPTLRGMLRVYEAKPSVTYNISIPCV